MTPEQKLRASALVALDYLDAVPDNGPAVVGALAAVRLFFESIPAEAIRVVPTIEQARANGASDADIDAAIAIGAFR